VCPYRFFIISFLSFLGLFCSTKEPKIDPSVVVSLGNIFISSGDIEQQLSGRIKDSVFVYGYLSNWIEKELLYQGGRAAGVHRDGSVLQKTSDYNKTLVGMGFLGLSVKGFLIKKDDIKKYYSENKDEFKRKKEEIKATYFTTREKSIAQKIKRELRSKSSQKISGVIAKYRGVLKRFRFGELPPEVNSKVFSKNNFKKGNLLGPYLVDTLYYVLKIENVFPEGTYLGIDIVYDEIFQRLKNKAFALRLRNVVDSLKMEHIVKIDSQKIRDLFK